MVELDNLHYDFRRVDGFNKDFNFCISCREAGKSSMYMIQKAYRIFRKLGAPQLYLVRNTVEITEGMILTWEESIINKFTDDNVKLQYNKASFNDGIVDVKIDNKLFIRIMSMSLKKRKLKQTLLQNIYAIFFDEFIIDPRRDEKYLKAEADTFKEIYTTQKRERYDKNKPLKVYFCGNPYSMYNPYFMWLGVDVNKLKLGQFYVGDNYVIDYYKIKDELREKLLKENPLLVIDEEFKSYALDGKPINDSNIKTSKFPPNYHLRFAFKIDGKYIGVFQNNFWEDKADLYFCQYINQNKLSQDRNIFCFDFIELVNRCILLDKSERQQFNLFKIAMRKRQVAFSDISVYYLIEEIYYNL